MRDGTGVDHSGVDQMLMHGVVVWCAAAFIDVTAMVLLPVCCSSARVSANLPRTSSGVSVWIRPRACSSSNIWPGSSQSRILSDSSAWPSSIPPSGVRNGRTSAKSREPPASCAASPENTSDSRRLSTAAHISQRPRGTLTAEIIEHSGTDHGRVDLYYGLPVQSPVDVLRGNGTDSVGQALGGQLGDGLLRRPLLRSGVRSPRLSLARPPAPPK